MKANIYKLCGRQTLDRVIGTVNTDDKQKTHALPGTQAHTHTHHGMFHHMSSQLTDDNNEKGGGGVGTLFYVFLLGLLVLI